MLFLNVTARGNIATCALSG